MYSNEEVLASRDYALKGEFYIERKHKMDVGLSMNACAAVIE